MCLRNTNLYFFLIYYCYTKYFCCNGNKCRVFLYQGSSQKCFSWGAKISSSILSYTSFVELKRPGTTYRLITSLLLPNAFNKNRTMHTNSRSTDKNNLQSLEP